MAAWSFGRKAVVASVLVSLLLVVSSSLVAATVLSDHNRPTAAGPHSGPSWGQKHATYAVTFEESGLPSGASWSVQLFGATPFWESNSNSSNTSTIGFELRNGTYDFSIGGSANNSAQYIPTPSSGNLTVNGTAVTEAIAFAPLPLTDVTFSETGLPAGTFWSVGLSTNSSGPVWGGDSAYSPDCFSTTYWNGSVTATVAFELPNGTYNYSVGNVTVGAEEFVPTPMSGNFTANGTPVSIEVSFASVPLYNLTFDETGLPGGAPNGTFWFVQISNASVGYFFNGTSNTSIGFTVPDGTYNFTVGNVTSGLTLYVPTPSSGNVTVDGAAETVAISFAPVQLYNLTFVESGLPNGTFWSVGLWNRTTGGTYNASSGPTIGFLVPNGTYNFSVAEQTSFPWTTAPFCANGTGNGSFPGTIYVATPSSGSVTVDGANETVSISFAPLAYYTVTFNETGLPNGTFWSVELAGDSNVGSGSGWGGLSPQCWGATYWNGSWTPTIGFSVTNGLYTFAIGNVTANGSLYVPSPMSGNVTVNGTDVVVDVSFSAVPLYQVDFVETGLPNGSFWSVVLGGPPGAWYFNGSDNSSVGFAVPDGTYNFTVGTPFVFSFAGANAPLCSNGSSPGGQYAPTPASGTVTVDGANVTVSITFARLAFYTVTFQETGLPNGTFWWVALDTPFGHGWSGGASPLWGGSGGPGWSWNFTSLTFYLPNGTYNFTVGNATSNGTLYVPTPASGSVTVSGSNLTVSIAFADPPSGGHPSTLSPRAGGGAPELGTTVAVGAAMALLAMFIGALLLARRRGPTRSPPAGGIAHSSGPRSPTETVDGSVPSSPK